MAEKQASAVRKTAAIILDFFSVFFAGGFMIASVFGGRTQEGFNLSGAPALLLYVLIAVYFFVFIKYLGGTLWQRILGVR